MLLILLVGFLVYKIIIKPYFNRRHYTQYQNVRVLEYETTEEGESLIEAQDRAETSYSRPSLVGREYPKEERKEFDMEMMHIGKDYIDSLPGYKYMLFDIKKMSLRVFYHSHTYYSFLRV